MTDRSPERLEKIRHAGTSPAPSTDALREQIAGTISFVGGSILNACQVAALAQAVESVIAPLLAGKRDEVEDWTRRAAEIDDLLAASRARVAELTRERDTALELLEAPAPLDGRLTDADDYGRDYDAQAHALGLPEVGEAGEPPAGSTRPHCRVCDMPLCEVSAADPCAGCCACVGSFVFEVPSEGGV